MIIIKNKLKFNVGDLLYTIDENKLFEFKVEDIQIKTIIQSCGIVYLSIEYYDGKGHSFTDVWNYQTLKEDSTKELFKTKEELAKSLLYEKPENIQYIDINLSNSFDIDDEVWLIEDNKLTSFIVNRIRIDSAIRPEGVYTETSYNGSYRETYKNNKLTKPNNLFISKEEVLNNLLNL